MKTIALISCVSKKKSCVTRAEDLYNSPLFMGNLRCARQRQPDRIFILSAKYGLLDLDTFIEPYDLTLNRFSVAELKDWSERVLSDLAVKTDLQQDLFVFYAGERYRKFLLARITSYEIPHQGLSIGKQLQQVAKCK
jgi:hypothetical protein